MLLLLLLLPLALPRRSLVPGLGLIFSLVVQHDEGQLPPPEVELGDAGPKGGTKDFFNKNNNA